MKSLQERFSLSFMYRQPGPFGERESSPKGHDSGLSDETGGGKQSGVFRLRVLMANRGPSLKSRRRFNCFINWAKRISVFFSHTSWDFGSLSRGGLGFDIF